MKSFTGQIQMQGKLKCTILKLNIASYSSQQTLGQTPLTWSWIQIMGMQGSFEKFNLYLFIVYYSWMYWTDYGSVDRIERASMDGTSRQVLHDTGLSTPYGITLDYATQTLYWTDYTLDNLESSNADGSNRRLLTRVNIQCPYGITFFDGRLYWGDWCQHVIYSTPVNSINSISTLISTGNDPNRIHVISEESQPITGK